VISVVNSTTSQDSFKMLLCLHQPMLFLEKAASFHLALWVVGHQSDNPGSGVNCMWSEYKKWQG
jgi:hypothetical protein